VVSMLTYDNNKPELASISTISRELAALLSDDKWEFTCRTELNEVLLYLKQNPLLDLVCFDITVKGAISVTEEVRVQNQGALLLLIADTSISPLHYLKPSIMASSLLLRPFSMQQLKSCMEELIQTFLKRTMKHQDQDVFIIEKQEGRQRISYDRIYYFEAKGKKVFLGTENQEIGFYETIENLAAELPTQFLRCHRSFIINCSKIQKIAYSSQTIYMENNLQIPFSRSYKNAVKERQL
jgi:DNA-binding LytR/AlgR family response regulator